MERGFQDSLGMRLFNLNLLSATEKGIRDGDTFRLRKEFRSLPEDEIENIILQSATI